MANESRPSIDPSFSSGENTSRLNTSRTTSNDRVLDQEKTINKDAPFTGNITAPTALKSLSIPNHGCVLSEAVTRDATIMHLTLAGQEQGRHPEDGPPNTPESFLPREHGPLLTPVTPVPFVSDTGPGQLSLANDHQAGQVLMPLETTGSSFEGPLTACPAFDPEPVGNLIAEHRTATVKKFHDIIQYLDTVNAELQWMLSEFLTRHYEQIEETLASNYKIIAQQEKDQELLQEQILSFLNAMKSAFAIFGGKDDS
ncbi:MAG: hypothetical protein J3R72DRAFT_439674 [Linnemannia gamsii]|nr:MAG: hypothetical protein J3R72DRAFT_439674 [Linnemannia gamsii]